ncbi:MAG: HEAT repeat domain-containing protein [Methylococcaceae bacterium]
MKIRTFLLMTTITLTGLAALMAPRNPSTPQSPTVTKGGYHPSATRSRIKADHHSTLTMAESDNTAETADPTVYTEASPKHVTDTPLENSPSSGLTTQHWQNWRIALLTGDVGKIPLQGGLLAENLRKNPEPYIYQEIALLLGDPSLSLGSKNLVVGLLGEIATTEAMSELISLAEEGNESPLYLASLQAIAQIASNRWGGRFHEELSTGLETAWQNLQNKDPAYAATLAKAIASVGAPRGVDTLLNSLTDPSRQGTVDDSMRLKQKTAFAAIPEVRNPAAIQTLSERVNQDSIETPGFEISGLSLASMGIPEATEQLLNWSETAPADAANRVEDWFSKIQDSASVNLLLTRQPELNFQSSEVESAFNQALNYLNPPLEDLTTPVPQDYSGLPLDTGLNTELLTGIQGVGNTLPTNTLEQALQTDPILAHPRRGHNHDRGKRKHKKADKLSI